MSTGRPAATALLDGPPPKPAFSPLRTFIAHLERSPLAAGLLALLLALVAKLPTLHNQIIYIDEPAYLVQAARLDSLEAFAYAFVYRTDTKFQLGLVPYMIGLTLSWENAMLVVRLLGLVAVGATSVLMVAISKRAFGSVVPGLAGLVLWLLCLNTATSMAAPLMEYFQVPLVLLAIWLWLRPTQSRPPGAWRLLAIGVCVALAALVKPPALLIGPVFGVWAVRERWPTGRARLWGLAALGLGIVAPIAIFSAPYVIRPETLAEVRFNFVDASSAYVLTPGAAEPNDPFRTWVRQTRLLVPARLVWHAPREATLAIVVVACAWFLACVRGRRLRTVLAGRGNEALLIALGAALFLGYTTGWAFDYYWVAILPPLLLVWGKWLQEAILALARPRPRWRALGAVAGLLSLAVIGPVRTYPSFVTDAGRAYREDMPAVDVPRVVDYVQLHTRPGDGIWVYYNAPEVYWLSHRRPATSEPIGSSISAFPGDVWFNRTYQELVNERPALIVGLAEPHYPVPIPSLADLPYVRDLVAREYVCDERAIANGVVCLRAAR